MICTNCQTPNEDHFKFCRECGRRLTLPNGSEATVASPALHAAAGAAPLVRLDEAEQAARLLEQAFDLYEAGRYEDAVGACQAAGALDPTSGAPHSLLGMIYERMGRTSEAVQQYQLVVKMTPDSIADATRLDSLLSRPDGPRRLALPLPWLQGRRGPMAAGAVVAALALVMGVWATSRAVSPRTSGAGRVDTRAPQGPIPGASMPRQPAPTMSMPGAEEALAPAARTPPAPPAAVPGASLPQGTGAPQARPVPAPPPANAWPGLRGAYPRAQPATRWPQTAGQNLPTARTTPPTGTRTEGYLAPAPIQGVEQIQPGASTSLPPVPGAGLPAFPGAPPDRSAYRRPGRGPAPVLPPVSAAGGPPAASLPPSTPPGLPPQQIQPRPLQPQHVPPQAPPAVAPPAPPSASISIQPLDEQEQAEAVRGERQSAVPQGQ